MPTITPELQKQIDHLEESMKDLGDEDKLVDVLNESEVEWWYSNAEPPLGKFLTTRYTHNCISTTTPAQLDAQLKMGIRAQAEFETTPTVNNASRLLFTAPRAMRFHMLNDILKAWSVTKGIDELVTNDERAELILDAWVDTEIFDSDYADEWNEVIEANHDVLQYHTLPFDHNDLVKDNQITLYHGIEYDHDGYTPRAWTTSHRVAEFFARRYSGSSGKDRGTFVISITWDDLVEHASFYTDGRNEKEVYFIDDPRELVEPNGK